MHTMECYSAVKRKEILTHTTTWMNLEDMMLSEINQSQKDKYHDSIYMRYLESSTSEEQKVKGKLPGAGEIERGS